MQDYLIIAVPVALGLVYVLGSICTKRAMELGVDAWRVTILSLACTLAMHLPIFLFATTPAEGARLYQPILCGATFFGGMVLNVLALRVGDVSVAAPVMGTKVLFVPILTMAMIGVPVARALWVGSVLVLAALTLLRGPGRGDAASFWPTVGLAASSSLCFAICDVGIQAWVPAWGTGLLGPLSIVVACVMSLALLPLVPWKAAASPAAKRWLLLGIPLTALMVVGMTLSLSLFRQPNSAATINIAYNSRGVWSVLAIWTLGQSFGGAESGRGPRVLAARLAGAVMLLGAIALAAVGV